jgi:hypothetical protein
MCDTVTVMHSSFTENSCRPMSVLRTSSQLGIYPCRTPMLSSFSSTIQLSTPSRRTIVASLLFNLACVSPNSTTVSPTFIVKPPLLSKRQTDVSHNHFGCVGWAVGWALLIFLFLRAVTADVPPKSDPARAATALEFRESGISLTDLDQGLGTCIETLASRCGKRNGPPAQPARGLRPLGTPVGPVRVVKLTMASVVESTERALSEVEQGSAQGLLDNRSHC